MPERSPWPPVAICRSTASMTWTSRSRPDARACAVAAGPWRPSSSSTLRQEPPAAGAAEWRTRPELGGDLRLAGRQRRGARARRARCGPCSRSRSSTASARSGSTTSRSRPRPTPRPAPGPRSTSPMTPRTGSRWRPRRRSPPAVRSTSPSCCPAAGRAGGLTTVKEGRLSFSSGGRARFLGVSLMPHDRLPRARTGRRPGRSAGAIRHQPGPARRARHAARAGPRPARRHARRHQGLRPGRPGPARSPDRRAEVAGDLRGAGAPGRPGDSGSGDGVAAPGLLPDGGGPAAYFDPTIGKLALANAQALLDHVNPETGLALREDPALAWVTLAGEISMFDQIERPESLPAAYAAALHDAPSRHPAGSPAVGSGNGPSPSTPGRWPMTCGVASSAPRSPGSRTGGASPTVRPRPGRPGARPDRRPDLLDAPRIREFAVAGDAVDALEPRGGPDRPAPRRSGSPTGPTWSASGATRPSAPGPCRPRPADYLLGVYTAGMEDWDALVRRGLFRYPVNWGEGPVGLVGGEDIFQFPEVINGSPHVYALFPHAASLFHRGVPARLAAGRHQARGGARTLPGWDPGHGRLVIDTPFTQALVGWSAEAPARLAHLEFSTDNDVRRAGRHVDRPRADRRGQAAAGHRDRPGRADRLPLGRSLEDLPWPTRAGRRCSRSPSGRGSPGGARARSAPSSSITPANASARLPSRSSPTARASPSSSTARRPASTGSWSSSDPRPTRFALPLDPRTLAR